MFEQPIAVDWAEPEPEVDESVMATVKVIYVRNLMLHTTEHQIREAFERLKENSVERVKKMKDFAFVHFKEREDALEAIEKMNGAELDGALIECSLSKPADKTLLQRLGKMTANIVGQNVQLLPANAAIDLNILLNQIPLQNPLAFQPPTALVPGTLFFFSSN